MAIPRITKEELKERLEATESAGAPVIIDVRLKYPYEHSSATLPGAVRMLGDQLDTSRIPKDREVVTYDSDPEELVSAGAAATLIRQGYRARALEGGIGEWIGAKYPTEAKSSPQMAPPKPGSLK